MALFDWKNNEAGNTKVSASNLNLAQQKMVDTIYSVGSIYKSFDNTNPSEIFGGTWEAIKCSDLLETGLTSSNDLYRLYSDGYVEIRGARAIPNLQANTGHDESIDLGFGVIDGLGVRGVFSEGGSNWANANLKISKGTNSIQISVWNNMTTTTENIVVDFTASGYVTNRTPIYAWKRTA